MNLSELSSTSDCAVLQGFVAHQIFHDSIVPASKERHS
jgi:hypothetical protein